MFYAAMMFDDDPWGENEWGAEDDGMGFGVDVAVGDDDDEDMEDRLDPALEGMGSDIEEIEEEEREL